MGIVLRLALIILTASVMSGCTHMYVHDFGVVSVVPGSQVDEQEVFRGFRQYLSDHGMQEVKTEKSRDGYVAFLFGSGRSGMITRSPYHEYLELSYADTDGFLIRLIRIISHPVDFSRAQLEYFMRETERFLADALPNSSKLEVVERAIKPDAARDVPSKARP